MPNYTCYTELNELNSNKVRVFNRFHGWYSINELKSEDIIVYTSFGEYLTVERFKKVCRDFGDKFVILVTAQSYPGLPTLGPNYKIFKIPTAYAFYSSKIAFEPMTVDIRHFEKLFLSLNNRCSWNRQALTQFVINHNLIDRMYFSYHCSDRYNIGKRKLYDETNEIIGADRTWFNKNIDYDRLYDRLPILTELELLYKDDKEINDWSFGHKDYYEKSFCSIINETYIDETNDQYVSEKTFKAIAYTHPFLVFCSSGTLNFLKTLGFETFNDIFDESYDSITNPALRLEKIFREMLRIANLDNNALQTMYSKIIPVLRHNHNVFWNELPSKYKRDIQLVKQEIQSIIETI